VDTREKVNGTAARPRTRSQGGQSGLMAPVKGPVEAGPPSGRGDLLSRLRKGLALWRTARGAFDNGLDHAARIVHERAQASSVRLIDVAGLPPDTVLTKGGGLLDMADELAEKVAIFADGRVVVADERDPTVLSYIAMAMSMLTGLPESADGTGSGAPRIEVAKSAAEIARLNGGMGAGPTLLSERFDNRPQAIWHDIFLHCLHIGATDLHVVIEGNETEFWARVNRRMVELSQFRKDREHGRAMVATLYQLGIQKSDGGDHSWVRRQGYRLTNPMVLPSAFQMARCEQTPTLDGAGHYLVMRLQRRDERGDIDPQGLGYTDDQIEMALRMFRKRQGAIIVGGRMNSGKTWSQAAFHSLTMRAFEADGTLPSMAALEDPTERVIYRCRHIGVCEGEDYDEAVRRVLRYDANRLLVSEIRSTQTAINFFLGAYYGQLVTSTLHTTSALGVVGRLIMQGVEPWTLAAREIWAGIIVQSLVRTLCPECRVPVVSVSGWQDGGVVNREVIDWLTLEFGEAGMRERMEKLYVGPRPGKPRRKDCPHCGGFGYAGMTLIAEVLEPNATLLELLTTHKTEAALKLWIKGGGYTMGDHAADKVLAGIVDANNVSDILFDHARAMAGIGASGRLAAGRMAA
jgi:general secretion pathway protein E